MRIISPYGWDAVCLPKQNGNMPAVQTLSQPLTQGTAFPDPRQISMAQKPCLWALIRPMPGVCTICMAMYGNGAATCMVFIQPALKPILPDPLRGRAAWIAAAAGTLMLRIAGVRAGTTSRRTAAPTTLASALCPLCEQWLFRP